MSVPSIFILESTKYLSFRKPIPYALVLYLLHLSMKRNIICTMEDKQNIEFLIEKIEDLNSKDLNDFFLSILPFLMILFYLLLMLFFVIDDKKIL